MQIVVNQILIGLIAALGCLVGGTLLLPSLATDELREVLADIIQTCGYSISGYASRIFPPEQVNMYPSDRDPDTARADCVMSTCLCQVVLWTGCFCSFLDVVAQQQPVPYVPLIYWCQPVAWS